MSRSFPNGTTDALTNTSINFTPGTSGTVSLWFQPNFTTPDSLFHQILNITPGGLDILSYVDGNAYMGWNSGAGRVIFSNTGVFTTGVWMNIIVTWSGTPLQVVYINGVSKGSTAQGTVTGTSLAIGNVVSASGGTSADGQISDVAFWNVVLTAGEIAAIVKGARPFKIRPLALQFFMPLDGLQSPEPDLSGFKTNGTLTGGITKGANAPVMMFTPRWPTGAILPFTLPPPQTLFAQACL